MGTCQTNRVCSAYSFGTYLIDWMLTTWLTISFFFKISGLPGNASMCNMSSLEISKCSSRGNFASESMLYFAKRSVSGRVRSDLAKNLFLWPNAACNPQCCYFRGAELGVWGSESTWYPPADRLWRRSRSKWCLELELYKGSISFPCFINRSWVLGLWAWKNIPRLMVKVSAHEFKGSMAGPSRIWRMSLRFVRDRL